MFWIFLLFLFVGCAYVFNSLRVMEAEIRAEIDSANPVDESNESLSDSVCNVTSRNDSESIDERLIGFIKNRPGVRQSELYKEFNSVGKASLQKELLNLDRSGKISRIRSGSTYQLSVME